MRVEFIYATIGLERIFRHRLSVCSIRTNIYACHSQQSTEIDARYGSVRTKTEYSVMSDAPCEVWSLKNKK